MSELKNNTDKDNCNKDYGSRNNSGSANDGTLKIKVAAVTPFVSPGAFESNAHNTLKAIQNAESLGAEIIVLPKNSFSGDCGDYRFLESVQKSAMHYAQMIIAKTSAVIVFGMFFDSANLALIALGGRIVTARLLDGSPNDFARFLDSYKELNLDDFYFKGVEIRPSTIKDIENLSQFPPNSNPKTESLILTVSAAYPAYIGQSTAKKAQMLSASSNLNCAAILSCSGAGESTIKYVRSGDKIITAHGRLLKYADFDDEIALADYIIDKNIADENNENIINSNTTLAGNSFDSTTVDETNTNNTQTVNFKMTIPRYLPKKEECGEIYDILSRGIVGRIREAKANGVIFGLSGGLDSANVLVAAANAEKYGLRRENIICVTMPSENSSHRTATNAQRLIDGLGVTGINVPIGGMVDALLGGISHDKKDVVYENAQARTRAAVLLSLANKHNCLVLGTSDLSEMALGFSTYGGDQLAHYNPNSSLTKSAIRLLIKEYALSNLSRINNAFCHKSAVKPSKYVTLSSEQSAKLSLDNSSLVKLSKEKYAMDALIDIIDTPVSPELLPNQHTEDILGPYPLHEYFLLRLIAYKESTAQILSGAITAFGEYSADYIKKIYSIFVDKFFANRFKTNFSCDGISLTPYDLSALNFNSGFSAECYKNAGYCNIKDGNQ